MMRSALSLRVRLCPSWPGLAPPGFDFSRCSLRSVEGGFEDVREVFSGRCRRSTKSISSSLLRRSSSLRPIPPFNQSKQRHARAWVIARLAPGLSRRPPSRGAIGCRLPLPLTALLRPCREKGGKGGFEQAHEANERKEPWVTPRRCRRLGSGGPLLVLAHILA